MFPLSVTVLPKTSDEVYILFHPSLHPPSCPFVGPLLKENYKGQTVGMVSIISGVCTVKPKHKIFKT